MKHKVDLEQLSYARNGRQGPFGWRQVGQATPGLFYIQKKANKKFSVQYGHYIFGNGDSVEAPAGVGGGAGQRPPPDHTPSVRTSVNRPTAPRFTNIMHYSSTFSPPSPATVSMLPKLHEETVAADEP